MEGMLKSLQVKKAYDNARYEYVKYYWNIANASEKNVTVGEKRIKQKSNRRGTRWRVGISCLAFADRYARKDSAVLKKTKVQQMKG